MDEAGHEEDLTLGEYVRRLRRMKRWDLQQLANASHLSTFYLSRVENDNAVPKADTVVKLSNALDGDLNRMLQLADCLPREILERLIRRADDATPALRRATGEPGVDPGFPTALVGDLDPTLRQAIADRFELSVDDVNGIFAVLQRLAHMNPSERRSVLDFLASAGGMGS